MALYVSNYARFMQEQMEKHPEWAEGQRVGRDLLWDRPIDWQQQKAFAEVSERPKAYPYDAVFSNTNTATKAEKAE